MLDTVWNSISDRVGEDLRAVTKYGGTDFETRMRDDVREQYTAEEDRRIVDETIIDQLRVTETSRRFVTGEIDAIVRIFEEAWIVSWPKPDDPKAGMIVSIQRDGERATIADVEWVVDYLDDEIAPGHGSG